jgi:UV DNA damage endonuclease
MTPSALPAGRLGFAVKVVGDGGLPSHDTRRWRSGPSLDVSLDRLADVFDRLERIDVRMYRMSSNLAPYETHPEHTRFHGQVEACAPRLERLGARARALGLRLSMHPGQYTVLNSVDARVRDLAVAELSWQARLMDLMGLGPEAVIVLHVGSGAPDRATALERFVGAAERLPEPARRRLVVENDDRAFGLADVLEVSRRTGAPVVWDVHHHRCLDREGIPEREALDLALATWPAGVRPKVHYSSPRTAIPAPAPGGRGAPAGRLALPSPRAHADLVDPFDFRRFAVEVLAGRPIDVMLEAKAKDVALLRLREQLRRTEEDAPAAA